ncbi:YqgE/AlgH family protein [Phaeodactylibacter luteus]|uniref:UPF0301 protein FRY97_13350 n=1 Tax=Phaeodactylibacter luteus TaxID=1564516 RepID=A0A5C6RL12_9BACT|nr:YqgE/AlgH family protein [Phaeodactylibacter luteus]TXB62599.1 YqgE/AlgH family protein [Phaeodactylibacter luteus]
MIRKTDVSTGKILLAEPFMMDPHFRRSAVLLCDHGKDGSVGFILDKPLDMRIDELIATFPEIEATVFYGGPVQTDTVHYLHTKGDLVDGSREVTDGIFWGGDFEKLKFLISSKLILPTDIRFFVGYSGWSEGQLAEEMETGSWILSEMFFNYLFGSTSNTVWKEALEHKGDSYAVIANMPDHQSWN